LQGCAHPVEGHVAAAPTALRRAERKAAHAGPGLVGGSPRSGGARGGSAREEKY
jgi:hypothetical protein